MNIKLVKEVCSPSIIGEIKNLFSPGDLVLLPSDIKDEQVYLQYKKELVEKTAKNNKVLILTGFHLSASSIMDELSAVKSLAHKGVILFLFKSMDSNVAKQAIETFDISEISLG